MTSPITEVKSIKNLLILAAMAVEEKAILSNRKYSEEIFGKVNQFTAKHFALGSCEIWTTQCGVGLVNAGLSLATLSEHIALEAVVLLGVGGALDRDLNIGDLVLADRVIQHDSVASIPNGAELIAPGELYLSLAPENRINPIMNCDPKLVAWISDAFQKHSRPIKTGLLLSGSEFVASAQRKLELVRSHPGSLLVDMEAAGIAQIARKRGIPFVVAKTVADRLRPEGSISQEYSKFLNAASEHSADVLRLLETTFQ